MEITKRELIGETGIDTKLRLMLFDSLITSIILFSLHIIPICNNSINKLQQFHSKCARIITKGYYQSGNPQVRNDIARQKFNIQTAKSKLKYFRPKSYYKWGK